MNEELIKELRKDNEPGSLFYVWQSGIAIAFNDEYLRWQEDNGIGRDSSFPLKGIANRAAKNFLNTLIRENNEI